MLAAGQIVWTDRCFVEPNHGGWALYEEIFYLSNWTIRILISWPVRLNCGSFYLYLNRVFIYQWGVNLEREGGIVEFAPGHNWREIPITLHFQTVRGSWAFTTLEVSCAQINTSHIPSSFPLILYPPPCERSSRNAVAWLRGQGHLFLQDVKSWWPFRYASSMYSSFRNQFDPKLFRLEFPKIIPRYADLFSFTALLVGQKREW